MAKFQKRVSGNWSIGTHTINSYKERVDDPALKRKKRNANDIRKVLSRALNRVRAEGKNVDIHSNVYRGKEKLKRLYRITLFKTDYYILTSLGNTISLFTPAQILNDIRRGGLVFLDNEPFEELKNFVPEDYREGQRSCCAN